MSVNILKSRKFNEKKISIYGKVPSKKLIFLVSIFEFFPFFRRKVEIISLNFNFTKELF
jgi:hypothetical protein